MSPYRDSSPPPQVPDRYELPKRFATVVVNTPSMRVVVIRWLLRNGDVSDSDVVMEQRSVDYLGTESWVPRCRVRTSDRYGAFPEIPSPFGESRPFTVDDYRYLIVDLAYISAEIAAKLETAPPEVAP